MTVKVLIIRFSSIGDIVLTTPVIRCLKTQLEGEVEIHYLTKQGYAPLLQENPYLSKIHTIEKSTQEVYVALKDEKYDFIVDLHKNLRSARVKRQLKGFSFTVDKLNWQKWLMIHFGIKRKEGVKHIVDRYLAAVSPLGIRSDGKGLDYFIPKNEEVELTSLPKSHHKGYVGLVIGAQYEGKKMTESQLIELCHLLSSPIVLLGGKEDAKKGKTISQKVGQKVFNACGMYSIHQSASLVKQAKVIISHDTGLMHIAASFGKPIVSVWGCTAPAIGMSPYMQVLGSVTIEPNHLKKRPCSKLGNRCKYGKAQCIKEVDLAKIAEAVEAAIPVKFDNKTFD